METEKIVYKIVDSPIGKFVAGATPKGCCVYEFFDRGGVKRIKTRVEKRHNVKMEEGTNKFINKMETQVGE